MFGRCKVSRWWWWRPGWWWWWCCCCWWWWCCCWIWFPSAIHLPWPWPFFRDSLRTTCCEFMASYHCPSPSVVMVIIYVVYNDYCLWLVISVVSCCTQWFLNVRVRDESYSILPSLTRHFSHHMFVPAASDPALRYVALLLGQYAFPLADLKPGWRSSSQRNSYLDPFRHGPPQRAAKPLLVNDFGG